MSNNSFTFSELAGGAVEEALQEVMNNIDDPNTEAKKARKLTLSVTFKPGENRVVAETEFQVKTTLVSPKGINTTLLMERDETGKMVASEMYGKDPNQQVLFDDEKVVPMKNSN